MEQTREEAKDDWAPDNDIVSMDRIAKRTEETHLF